jgi:cytochrome b subunit of formate dehydrogenase
MIETSTDASGTVVVTAQQKVRVWMQVVVSLVLLVTGILVLIDPSWLPHFDESTKKIAAGWVGAVVGYWLS